MTGFSDLKFLLGLALGVLLSAIVVAFKKQLERALDSLLSKVPLTISKFIRYRRWEKKYRKVIYEEHRHLKFVGVKHSITLNRPKLEDVFVNLEMQAASATIPSQDRSELTLHETLNLDVALKKFTHLAILGNPGAGKTTLFEYILCVCCGNTESNANRDIVGLLPIYVPLRRCSSQGKTFLEQLTDPSTRLLPPDLLKSYPPDFFERYLNKGKCILLFDGLDEVLNEDDHVAAARMVETTAAIYPKCRVLVNSRSAGWRNLLGSQFVRFVIRELSQREITGLVSQWYLAVINEQLRTAATANIDRSPNSSARRIAYEQSEKMLAVLHANPRLMQIASTPLILSLMCLVFHTRQDLPKKRARLYEECIEILLEEWDRREKQISFTGMPSLEQKVLLLERIAVRLFENNVSELSKEEMERVLEDFLSEIKLNLNANQMVRFIEERSGIISEKAFGVYGFTHLTFQEFFAATGLKHLGDGLSRLFERFKQTEIEEVVLLYAGVVERGDTLIGALLDEYKSSGNIRFLLAAGKAITEIRDLTLELKTATTNALDSAFKITEDITLLTTIQSILADLGINKEIIRSFGEYEISSELGRGGMSTVYLAKEKATGKSVALKIYNSGTAEQLERVQREMSILRNLNHPHLVQIFHLGRVNDQLFVATELLEGLTLDEVLNRLALDRSVEGVPSFASFEYYQWVRQVFGGLCESVSYLHENKIIHGDIKPNNIIWSGGKSKLIDFGLDMLIHKLKSITIDSKVQTILGTATDSHFGFPGTKGYISPERFFDKPNLGFAVDIYSLGKVLQVLWTLKRPSWEDTFSARRRNPQKKHAGASGKIPKTIKEASSEILSIIEKATSYEPQDRYKSVNEMWMNVETATSTFVVGRL